MTPGYYDQWYIDIAASNARQRLFTECLGVPPEIGPSNLLPLAGLEEVAGALALSEGYRLVDVACGRGGPGMWVARRTGASLVGVDFSPVALAQAVTRRDLFEMGSRASFVAGTMEAIGLASEVADALLCIDAFQFVLSGAAVAAEFRRVLRPGGRLALTTWQAVIPGDPALGRRIRAVDVAGALASTGFRDIEVSERADWHAAGYRLWERALALDAAGDPAMVSTQDEARRSLVTHGQLRRMFATATAP